MIKGCTGVRDELGEQGRTLRTKADLAAGSVRKCQQADADHLADGGEVEFFIPSSSLLPTASRQRNPLIQKLSSSSFSRSLDHRETIVCGFA